MQPIADQQKIPFLLASVFLLIFISMIGLGSAAVYSMVRWQSTVPEAYVRPLTIDKAVSDANTSLARLNNRTLAFIETRDPARSDQLNAEMLALDRNLGRDFSIVKAESPDNDEAMAELGRLLDDWQAARMQLTDLARRGQRDKALQLARGASAQAYGRLETKLDAVAVATHHRVAVLADAAKGKSSRLIRLAWWLLGGLATASIVAGITVIRRVRATLEHDRQTAKMLYESQERLRLALSGADEGTWDLDIATGQLNFDSQWGDILGYNAETERPHYFEEWAALIHAEDRDRVLQAMHGHVEGWTSEYKAEYRIRAQSGIMKWVVGHGRAVRRDLSGKALRVVGVTRDITLKKEAEDKIWQLAHSDFLTGLPNRPLFYDHLRQSIALAKRRGRKLALLFLDLDGFKQVNDRFGHDTGDGLLQEVAARLRQNIRGEDTAARTGGDEFIIILNDVAHAEDAAIVARKIIHALAEPFIVHGNTCLIGGSIGISIFPDDSDEMETLVTQADDAMYKAKGSGRNNYQFFASHE